MIFGIGTDILQISRIKAAIKNYGNRFAQKILGSCEMSIYLARSDKANIRGIRFLAMRFAVKEAFSKALSIGMRAPVTWHSIQVLNTMNGSPCVLYSTCMKTWMIHNQCIAHVSMSDEIEYVVASVVLEKNINISYKEN